MVNAISITQLKQQTHNPPAQRQITTFQISTYPVAVSLDTTEINHTCPRCRHACRVPTNVRFTCQYCHVPHVSHIEGSKYKRWFAMQTTLLREDRTAWIAFAQPPRHLKRDDPEVSTPKTPFVITHTAMLPQLCNIPCSNVATALSRSTHG